MKFLKTSRLMNRNPGRLYSNIFEFQGGGCGLGNCFWHDICHSAGRMSMMSMYMCSFTRVACDGRQCRVQTPLAELSDEAFYISL